MRVHTDSIAFIFAIFIVRRVLTETKQKQLLAFGSIKNELYSDADAWTSTSSWIQIQIRIRIVWHTKGASSTQPATMTANKPLSAATNRQKLKTVGIPTRPETPQHSPIAPSGPIKMCRETETETETATETETHPPRIDGWRDTDRNLGLGETNTQRKQSAKTMKANNKY